MLRLWDFTKCLRIWTLRALLTSTQHKCGRHYAPTVSYSWKCKCRLLTWAGEGSRGIEPLIINLGARWSGCSTPCPGRFTPAMTRTHCVGGCVVWTDMQKREFLTTTGFTLLEIFPVIRYAEGFNRPKKCRNSEEFPCPILPGNFLTKWVTVSFSTRVLPHWVRTQLPACLIKEYSLLNIKTLLLRGSAMEATIHWSVTAEGWLQS